MELFKGQNAVEFTDRFLIPCLWKTCFHVKCPGCGLTTASIKILTLDIYGAYKANPLIFIVLPVGSMYVLKDLKKIKEKLKRNRMQQTNT